MEWLVDHQPVIFERQNNAQCNQSLYQCTKTEEKHPFFVGDLPCHEFWGDFCCASSLGNQVERLGGSSRVFSRRRVKCCWERG